MKRTTTEESTLYVLGWILIGLACVILIGIKIVPDLWGGRLPACMFQVITGFYCPGCGGTRAVQHLLAGELLQSFRFHPLVLYTAAFGGWFMLSQTIERLSRGRLNIGMKYRDWYLWIALGIVVVNFLVKNAAMLLGTDLLGGIAG